MLETPTPLRQRLTAWIDGAMENLIELDSPALARAAVAEFKSDPEFTSSFFEAFAEAVFHTAILRRVAQTRQAQVIDQTPPQSIFAATGTPAPARSAPRRPQLKRGWELMFENIAANATKKVMEMTKADLLAAAENRGKRARAEHNFGVLWLRVANNLEDNERVRDKYTAEDLQALMDEIETA